MFQWNQEGSCSIGTTSPSTTWYLPEGSSAWNFETWTLVENPGDTTADVTLTYLTKDGGFVFLDLITQSDVIGFLNGWRMKYPWVSGISLIKGVGNEIIMPEGILPLVVESSTASLFKFFENGAVWPLGYPSKHATQFDDPSNCYQA